MLHSSGVLPDPEVFVAGEYSHYTVNEMGRMAARGVYLATRRKDGWLFTEIKARHGKIRKFVNPKNVTDDKGGYDIRLIDKASEV